MQKIQPILHAFKNWSQNQIIYPINTLQQLSLFNNRNYSYLIYLDTPVNKRFQNYQEKNQKKMDMKSFLEYDQLEMKQEIFMNNHKWKIVIKNCQQIGQLEEKITQRYIIPKFRPDWDLYFMEIAMLCRQRSNCMKRPVGAVIVNNNIILSTGYNGTPTQMINCFQQGCKRCNQNASQGKELGKCLCLHAQQFAVLTLGKKKILRIVFCTQLNFLVFLVQR